MDLDELLAHLEDLAAVAAAEGFVMFATYLTLASETIAGNKPIFSYRELPDGVRALPLADQHDSKTDIPHA